MRTIFTNFIIFQKMPVIVDGVMFCLFFVLGGLVVNAVSMPLFLVPAIPMLAVYLAIQRYYIASSRWGKHVSWHTVRCRYNGVNFLQNPHKRHPIARPLGRNMGCLLWINTLIYIPPQLLKWYMQYVTLDRIIMGLHCIHCHWKYHILLWYLFVVLLVFFLLVFVFNIWCFKYYVTVLLAFEISEQSLNLSIADLSHWHVLIAYALSIIFLWCTFLTVAGSYSVWTVLLNLPYCHTSPRHWEDLLPSEHTSKFFSIKKTSCELLFHHNKK